MTGGGPARHAAVPRPFRVHRVQKETADTFTLELRPEGPPAPFPFAAGQFNMLYVFGVGEAPISICGNPARPETLVHTTRVVGPVTRGLGALRRGDAVGVRGPFGSSWPVDAAAGSDVVFVAGGIGLAPLRPALHEVLARRERYGRVVLLYGARTPEDVLYGKQLRDWRADAGLEVHVTVDRATRDWRGSVGVVTSLVPRVPFDPYHAVAMVCGPELMMRLSVLELERRGVPAGSIHVSLERNMRCGVGCCGRCQLGPTLVCRDGPVFPYLEVRPLLGLREA